MCRACHGWPEPRPGSGAPTMAAAAGRAGLLGFGALGFVCLVGRAGEREAVDSCSAGDWLASSDGLCYECAGRGGAASMMVLLAIVVLTAAFVVGCWYVMQLLAGAEEREAEAQQQQLASGGMKKTRAAKMREDSGGAGSPTPLSDVLTGAKISIDHFQSLRFIAHCGVRWPSSTLAVWAPLAATVGLGVDLMVDLLMSTRLFVYLCYEQISLRTRTWVLFVPLVLTLLIARGYSARQRAAEVERVQQAQYEAEPTAGDDENVIDKAARSLRKKRENFESEDGDGAAAAELREQLSKRVRGNGQLRGAHRVLVRHPSRAVPQALRLRLRPEAIGPRVYLRDDDRRGVRRGSGRRGDVRGRWGLHVHRRCRCGCHR